MYRRVVLGGLWYGKGDFFPLSFSSSTLVQNHGCHGPQKSRKINTVIHCQKISSDFLPFYKLSLKNWQRIWQIHLQINANLASLMYKISPPPPVSPSSVFSGRGRGGCESKKRGGRGRRLFLCSKIPPGLSRLPLPPSLPAFSPLSAGYEI